MASLILGPLFARSYIPFMIPQVLRVILLGLSALPFLLVRIATAFLIASRFCIGSPIPMNTILSRVPASFSINRNSSTISLAVRFLPSPRVPVWQNAHPMAQPAWHETHAVFLPSRSVRRTVSIALPSCKVICSLIVPSGSFRTLLTLDVLRRAFSSRIFLVSLSRFFMASKDSTPFETQRKICFARNAGLICRDVSISSGNSAARGIFVSMVPTFSESDQGIRLWPDF